MSVSSSPTFLKLLLATGSFLAGVFLMELVLLLMTPTNELEGRARAARDLGLPFDSRTRLEVVETLRKKGVDAWPTMKPYLMLTEERHEGATQRSAGAARTIPFSAWRYFDLHQRLLQRRRRVLDLRDGRVRLP